MSVIRSASISAQRAAAAAETRSEVFERRVHSVESSQPMHSHCFTMTPTSDMFIELPQPKQPLRYQLLVEDKLDQLEHNIGLVTAESVTILVRNLADVERRIYILWL